MSDDVIVQVRERLTALDTFMSETTKQLQGFDERLEKWRQASLSRPPGGVPLETPRETLGRLVTASAEMKQFLSGTVRGTAKVAIPGRIPGLIMKTTITTGVNLKPSVVSPPVEPLPHAGLPLSLGDLIPSTPLGQGYLQSVRQTGTHPTAGVQLNEGDAKAEGVVTFSTINQIPETIACWIPVSRQAAQDINGLTALIDSELMYAVKILEENQILNGLSTFATPLQGELLGLNTNSTAITTASTTILDIIADLLGGLMATGVKPDGLVMNPLDWLAVAKAKASTGEYLLGSPAAALGSVLWSTPLALSIKQPAKTVLAGNFALGSRLWYREDSTIETSTEHADFFVRNLLAVRCEERLTLQITQPGYFAKAVLP